MKTEDKLNLKLLQMQELLEEIMVLNDKDYWEDSLKEFKKDFEQIMAKLLGYY